MKPAFTTVALLFCSLATLIAREPMSIDPLWQSAEFRRAFTGAYGTDGRIEPGIDTGERALLDVVAEKMRAGDRPGAIAALSGSPRTASSAALLFSLGSLRFEEGRAEEAVADLQKAIEKHANFRDAHRNLAVALVQLSRAEEAAPHLLRAMELGAQDGLTLGLLGYIHAGSGRHQAALQAYRLAGITMPAETQWKLGEAQALLALDEPRAASSLFGELLAARPDDDALWMSQADAFLQTGEPIQAAANLEIARRLGKLAPGDLISLGHLYANESLPADAAACYREAINAEKPAPFAKAVDAVEALTRYQQWTEANALARRVASLPIYAGERQNGPETARFERALALIEIEAGDAAAGAARVEALIQRDPLDTAALLLLARHRVNENRLPEAEMLLEQAARDPGREIEALRALGEVRVKAGKHGEALEPLRRAQELAPDPRLAEYLEAVARLAKELGTR